MDCTLIKTLLPCYHNFTHNCYNRNVLGMEQMLTLLVTAFTNKLNIHKN